MRREPAMEHLAIDLGGKESQICIRSLEGTILLERRMLTSSLKKYLAQRPKSRVVVETCTEAFGVADSALAAGHEVRVVPAFLVKSLGVPKRRPGPDPRRAGPRLRPLRALEAGRLHHRRPLQRRRRVQRRVDHPGQLIWM